MRTDLDEGDIAVMKTYGVGAYTRAIKTVEKELEEHLKKVNELAGTPGCEGSSPGCHAAPARCFFYLPCDTRLLSEA